MTQSKTAVMRGRMHGDRWSAHGEHAGIRSLSPLLEPEELRRFEIFEEFDDAFLREIGPDVTLAQWEADAVVFEEGTYLDLAFFVVEGEVEVYLAQHESDHRPIFGATVEPGVAEGRAPDDEAPAPPPTVEARADGEESITFLSSMDFDLARGERMRLGPGEIFGEIGALNGWPQSATVRTDSPCTFLQIRLPALRKLRRKSKALKARLDEIYRSRMLRQHLRLTPLLSDVPGDVLDRLCERVELVSCSPGDVVAREGEEAERLILVRSGYLKLSQSVGSGTLVVDYAGKGGTVGEAELLVDGVDGWQVTATSVKHSELVVIRRPDLMEAIREHPGLERRLWDTAVERIKRIGATRDDPRRSDLVDFTLEKGLAQGNSVLVIDLDTCTRCDDCVRACAETHGGVPRFVREGEVHEGFLVPRSCYHCEDPVCLVGCPTGAIRRAGVGEVVEIDPDLCIGCSACANNCPYDAITMYDLDTTWGEDAVPKYLRGRPRQRATKCDLCHEDPEGPACVASCPHGCATRVSGFEEFHDLLEEAGRGGDEG